MYHNLNTLQSRSGNQLPFTSINYGTCTLPEGRMVTKALIEGSIKGIGKFHKTSIFPCGIFQCMKGVNRKKGDPNYDLFQLACKSTALRLYPNYCNCNFSGQTSWLEYDKTMKQKVIDNLSKEDYDKLVDRLEENPELKDMLSLDIIEE
jgi:ribonucleoside-triphosphate reductase